MLASPPRWHPQGESLSSCVDCAKRLTPCESQTSVDSADLLSRLEKPRRRSVSAIYQIRDQTAVSEIMAVLHECVSLFTDTLSFVRYTVFVEMQEEGKWVFPSEAEANAERSDAVAKKRHATVSLDPSILLV